MYCIFREEFEFNSNLFRFRVVMSIKDKIKHKKNLTRNRTLCANHSNSRYRIVMRIIYPDCTGTSYTHEGNNNIANAYELRYISVTSDLDTQLICNRHILSILPIHDYACTLWHVWFGMQSIKGKRGSILWVLLHVVHMCSMQ